MMEGPAAALTLQFLAWVAEAPRTYAAAIAFVWLSALDPVQHRSPSRTATELTGTPLDWQLNFPLPASPMQRDLYDFHNFLLAVDVGICAVVAVLIVFIAWRFRRARN